MNAQRALARKTLSRQAVLIRRVATRAVANAAASAIGQDTTRTKKGIWSGLLSFASPESDFVAATGIRSTSIDPTDTGNRREFSSAVWSKSYTFASPEADFAMQSFPPPATASFSSTSKQSWSKPLSFASPASDFSSETLEERANRVWETYDEHASTDMAYSLSFASPEADFTSPHVQSLLDERQRMQLKNCEEAAAAARSELAPYDTRRELLDDTAHVAQTEPIADEQEEEQFHFEEIFAKTDAQPLPQNYEEATRMNDERAIVITESTLPFKIVCVNTAWEGLCGYTQEEARGHTLGDLLQGPETDVGAATALVDKLLHGMEAGAVLTNYAKGGRKFQNRLRVGTLKDNNDKVTHFVGVLKEINEMSEKFGSTKQMNSQMA